MLMEPLRESPFPRPSPVACSLCKIRGMGARETNRGLYWLGSDPKTENGKPWSDMLKQLSYSSVGVGLRKVVALAVSEDPATVEDVGMDLENCHFIVYSQLGTDSDTVNVLSLRSLVRDVNPHRH